MQRLEFLDEGGPPAPGPRLEFEDDQPAATIAPAQVAANVAPGALGGPGTAPTTFEAPSLPTEEQRATEAEFGVQATPEEAGGLPLTVGEVGGVVREAAGGLTFEFSDEIEAGLRSLIGDETFSEELAQIQAERDQFRVDNPILSTAANVTGAIGSIAVPAGAIARTGGAAGRALRGTTGVGRVARGAGAGATVGGLAGAGAARGGLEERLEGARTGAQTGAVVGAALPVAGRAFAEAGKLLRSAATRTQTLDQLRNLAQAAYSRAQESGLVLRPDAFRGFVNNIGPRAIQELDPMLTPKAFRVFQRMDDLADAQVGIRTLMQERQLLNRLVRDTTDATDRRALIQLRESLDGFMDNLGRNTIASGNAREATQALRDANNLWRRYRRGEVIDETIRLARENAKQGGFDREVRRRFRALARNKKQFRQFSAREQAAIRRAARMGIVTGPLAVLGTAAPRGFFSGVGLPLVSTSVAGPGALAIPAAGEVARQAVNIGARRRAQQAFEVATTGAPRAARLAPGEQAGLSTIILGQIPEATAAARADQTLVRSPSRATR